jgi:hypothetical protein
MAHKILIRPPRRDPTDFGIYYTNLQLFAFLQNFSNQPTPGKALKSLRRSAKSVALFSHLPDQGISKPV